MLQHVGPPLHQPRTLKPEGLLGPLRVKDIDREASAAKDLPLSACGLLEFVDGDDRPMPRLLERLDPLNVWHGGIKPLSQVDNLLDI
jgi:hypothetical protein